MIVMTVIKEHNKVLGYKLNGHAGYAPNGVDIVCSAVSTLHYVAKEYLNVLGVSYDVSEESGKSTLMLKDKNWLNTSQAPFKAIENMMTNLSNQYPNHVGINYNDITKREHSSRPLSESYKYLNKGIQM